MFYSFYFLSFHASVVLWGSPWWRGGPKQPLISHIPWSGSGKRLIYCIPVTLQCWIWPSSTCRESPRCQLETSLWTSSSRSGTWSCSSSAERAAWSWPSPRQTPTWPILTPSNWRRTSTPRVRQGGMQISNRNQKLKEIKAERRDLVFDGSG